MTRRNSSLFSERLQVRRLAVGVHQRERLDVADHRPQRQPAAVDVGAKRAAERETVGAGLLLDNAPGRGLSLLHGDETVDQLRPLDAGLGLDHAALGIEGDDPPHRPHVEQNRAGGELLAAHGVPSARDRDRLARGARRRQRGAQRLLGGDRDHLVDAGGIELRVDVVDQRARCCG